jgi:hypothetical protein
MTGKMGMRPDRLPTVPAGAFQQHQGAVRVDGKVGEGLLDGPVVGGLGSDVDDEGDVRPVAPEYFGHSLLVADIHVAVGVIV